MKESLRDKEVLAMYDTRAIQDYIFRTNKIKEIVGASCLIDNIIINGINKVIKDNCWDKTLYFTDWQESKNKDNSHEKRSFLTDKNIRMEVLFVGGGNAYVLFRYGTDCEKMNQALGKYFLNKTYSLNIYIAVVEKTDNYKNDYDAIQEEMDRIKAIMPEASLVGAMPFMEIDSITGYPLAKETKIIDETESQGQTQMRMIRVCTESYLKREEFQHKVCEVEKEGAEKILDNMVTKKGDNSTLAVVHIDGNSMGTRIKDLMKGKEGYPEAIETMREISASIQSSYEKAYLAMDAYIENELADRIRKDRPGKLIRKLISAGDDITFICNPKVAIPAAKKFIEVLSEEILCPTGNETKEEKNERALSACIGIAFCNSHFPFSDAYKVAEECCSNAKKRAKSFPAADHTGEKKIYGNFIDFQICDNIGAANLGEYRKRNYTTSDGEDLCTRPYYIPTTSWGKGNMSALGENVKKYNIRRFDKATDYFSDTNNLPRSQMKTLRDSLSIGKADTERYITFLKSRERKLPDDVKDCWYDALEMIDFNIGKEVKKDETKDNSGQ